MRHARFLIALLLVLALAFPLAAKDKKSLEKEIEKVLQDPLAARSFWGIEVVSLSSGKTLYSLNAEKLFVPASNTKLFTTAASLALVGPQHRFRTTVETTAPLDKYGRVSGDVVLVGRGDPNLSGRVLPFNLRTERRAQHIQVLEDLAEQLIQKGVKFIDGDVVADDSHYVFERYAEGWSQDDLVGHWGAPVSALTINDNLIFLEILPADRTGERAFITAQPFPDYYRIDNRVMTTPAGSGPRQIYISREPGSNQLTIWGTIPLDDTGAGEALAIENPADFAARLFRSILERRGVVVYGRTRTRHTELAQLGTFSVTAVAGGRGGGDVTSPTGTQLPPAPLVLASYESQPLVEDLRVINKVSQNLHAEMALRMLGRERGNSGSIEGGLEVVRSFAAQAGIFPEELALFDGSGLSRSNLISPRALIKLLRYADAQPWASLFVDTLPVAGTDGTLRERLRGTSAQGRVMGKTGTLGHHNALAGYVTTLKGERLAFVVVTNNHNLPGSRITQLVDKIVLAIVDDVQFPRKEIKGTKTSGR